MDLAPPDERRRHVRYPMRVEARVALPGGESRPCWIRDIGAGGLFLALEDPAGDTRLEDGLLVRDDKVVVRFAEERGSQSQTHSIVAPVARVLPNGVGLAFANLDPPSVEALRRLALLARQARPPETAPAPEGVHPASVTPPRVVVGDVMHTMRCLLALERQSGSTQRFDVTRPGPSSVVSAAGATGSEARENIIRALSELQRSPGFLDPNEDGRLALMDRLETAWRATGPRIAGVDATVIEIVSRLLDAILDDPQVKHEIKGFVRRLAIPLLKVALQDGFFFFANERHPARDVLNRLGNLAPETAEADRWAAGIGTLVDRVVDDPDQGGTAKGFDIRQSAFSEVLAELDTIVEQQDKRYRENVDRLIRERAKQQALVRSRRGAPADAGSACAPRAEPPELARWLARVDQLEAGDVVFGKSGDGRTQKLNLALLSDDRDSLLFVDSAGNKAATFTRQALAMQFRHGDLWVLDAASRPIVERGIYRVLNDMHRELARQATHDDLTGLLNSKGFEARVEQALVDAVAMGSTHALGMIELDAIPGIIEKCGAEPAGAVLKKFVPVLERQVRNRGIACRLQGGRLGVLLHDCTPEGAHGVVEGLRTLMESSRCTWYGEVFQLTISAGLVPVDETAGSVSSLFRDAAAALGRAHRSGGNRVHVHEGAALAPGASEADAPMVTGALDGAGLELRCQRVMPIGADTSGMPHYEILLGVRDGVGEVVSPGEFIRRAERNNEMQAVDRWVVRTVLQWMAENAARVDTVDGYSINLSGVTLADPGFIGYVLGCLSESRVPPAKVIFEVAESATIDTLPVAVNFIHALKQRGCRFSLDKFGTADASLTHLETLPIDYVKLDGSLVRHIIASPKDFAVVQSLNEISHFLGKKTIAGYVESDAVLAGLRQIGVDYAQGFGIERPSTLH